MVVNKVRIESYVDENDGSRRTVAILGEVQPDMDKILCPMSEENFLNLFKSAINNANFKVTLCRACARKHMINEIPWSCTNCIANNHSEENSEKYPLDAIVIIKNGKKTRATAFVPKKEL